MEDFSNKRESLVRNVELLEEEDVINLAGQLLDEGMSQLDLLECINEGMNRVGKLYEAKDYYIADLIMAGLIFKQVLELRQMTDHFEGTQHKKIGRILLGTVKGDIHDIGKDIFRGMLEANGFEVIDLGVDVSKETFLKKFEEARPDIIGLSGVLTNTIDAMKEVVEAFAEAGFTDKVKIIVGGNHLTADACQYIAADGFSNDASTGVRICRAWLNAARNGE